MIHEAITLTAGDLRATILPLGARLQSLRLVGVDHSLCLGANSPEGYGGQMIYAGPICGPVVNRIGGASFKIDGQTFETDVNEADGKTLHGGSGNCHARDWSVTAQTTDSVTLTLELPDGLGGFPGNRLLSATWHLCAPRTLDLTLTATTDAATPVNLAHHPYWCLDPVGGDHLSVAAAQYLPTTAQNLPTGAVADVADTLFDLRTPRALADPDLPYLDHNFCLSNAPVARRPVARLAGANGVTLDIETSAPGLQVFTGFDPRNAGSAAPGRFVALEPQHWPDAINHGDFPSILLRPGQTYRQDTRYAVRVNRNKGAQ
jgi:aldose 1-epimerase